MADAALPDLTGRHIGLLASSSSRQGGGVFEAMVAQAEIIRAMGGKVTVFAMIDADTDQDRARFAPSQVMNFARKGPPQISYAPGLTEAMIAADLDCLHVHGIWQYPSCAGAIWAGRTGRPYFITPHGMLDPWIYARGRWKKTLLRMAWENKSWRRAYALHALTPREAGDLGTRTGRAEIIMIPNAGPDPAPAVSAAPRAPVVLYIGRIHTKKNLLPLVAAWQDMAARGQHPEGARLNIAGWGADEDVAALRAAIAAAPEGIEFLGPVFGAAKQALLDEARFMVLPSLSEGLPMAILEAWAAGTPTIMTRECNLDMGFAKGAALECGFDAGSIAQALGDGWAMDHAAWQARAGAALDLAGSMFSARAVAAQWGKTYAAAIEHNRRHA